LDTDEAKRLEVLGEWPYKYARPMFVLEPWIGGRTPDDVPNDYKFFVFDGHPQLIQVHTGRGSRHRQYHYLPDWTPVAVRTSLSGDASLPRPPHLQEMLRQASIIGAPFDFMRVDLYDVEEFVYFGETTPFPASGMRRFDPRSFEMELGSHWTLPEDVMAELGRRRR